MTQRVKKEVRAPAVARNRKKQSPSLLSFFLKLWEGVDGLPSKTHENNINFRSRDILLKCNILTTTVQKCVNKRYMENYASHKFSNCV